MSDGLNKVQIIGNLGADPEMRYTADGTALTTFRVAVSRTHGEERKEETEWFAVVTWRTLAEQCGQHLAKGRKVYTEGSLKTRSWDKDGVKHYRAELVADRVLFLDGKANGAVPVADEDVPFA